MSKGQKVRTEEEVFADLQALATSAGFAHVLAYICWHDNFISIGDELEVEELLSSYSTERCLRSEIQTLLGLMVKVPLDLEMPQPDKFQAMLDSCYSLLHELHLSMYQIPKTIPPKISSAGTPSFMEFADSMFGKGNVIREAVFYGGEAAYIFQYSELAELRHANDNTWLLANKGFSSTDARKVLDSIRALQPKKLLNIMEEMKGLHPNNWTFLPAFEISLEEIVEHSALEAEVVTCVMQAVSYNADIGNDQFTNVSEFNIVCATPVIEAGDKSWYVFQSYSLAEALYDAPFYWFATDKEYFDVATTNRGEFTEKFAEDRLSKVFGEGRVHRNVHIMKGKGKEAGEIDVLVTYADRAIIVQAKSKRLTIGAKKGNDKIVKADFEKAVQHSYDQALICSKLLTDPSYKLFDDAGNELALERNFSEVYIFCLVSDHYPALSFQASQFLKYETSKVIQNPFVMDVFLLDILTEFLDTPLHFLSYLAKHSEFYGKFLVSQELTMLSHHLKRNLWLSDDVNLMHLADDLSVDLDAALMVRREGHPGMDTPEGILTKFQGTTIGNIIQEIDNKEKSPVINLGFMLLGLSEDTLNDLSRGIDHICSQTLKDGTLHDLTRIWRHWSWINGPHELEKQRSIYR